MAGISYSGTKYPFAVIKYIIVTGNNMIYKCVWSSCFMLSVAHLGHLINNNIFYKFEFQIFFLIITFLVSLLCDLKPSVLFLMYGVTQKAHVAE